ncbi:winged helix-turn-helix domain-containing protein [Ralstonia sp. UNC404CL21Col]|uniref:winged helix-turn-helix domain-containing protein n=1 Tax=Ralstonia sp. UNC404CL21Col TaxID=1380362 RepID=UPI00344F1B90
MSHLNSFSGTAFLIADPARAAMLTALLDGRALPAGELAHAAGVTAQTASTHLAKLLDGGLLVVGNRGAAQVLPAGRRPCGASVGTPGGHYARSGRAARHAQPKGA